MYEKCLGWAHQGEEEVLCTLLTLRDVDMYIPGGVLIAGEVKYEEGDVRRPIFFRHFPEEVKEALRASLEDNDKEESRIWSEEDWTPQRLAYMPAAVHVKVGRTRNAYIVAFSEKAAAAAAYKAGLRVRKEHGYVGPGGDEPYRGMVWRELIEYEKRQVPVGA